MGLREELKSADIFGAWVKLRGKKLAKEKPPR
jgi:hypothetical protein